ncbi:hypothetical protein, partial [Planococcus salinarum]|uniref:hypothetical protein n=1 Tax=Planococcus salinarum TaxID=622695 RepID=UPI001C8F3822
RTSLSLRIRQGFVDPFLFHYNTDDLVKKKEPPGFLSMLIFRDIQVAWRAGARLLRISESTETPQGTE